MSSGYYYGIHGISPPVLTQKNPQISSQKSATKRLFQPRNCPFSQALIAVLQLMVFCSNFLTFGRVLIFGGLLRWRVKSLWVIYVLFEVGNSLKNKPRCYPQQPRNLSRNLPGTYIGKDPIAKAVGEKW